MISQLKKELNDETITSICNKIFYYIKPEQEKADTYIEYRILTERESDFAGNKNLTETYYLQVDIFSYGNYKKLAQTVKNTLKSKGYISLSTDGDLYEEDTKLYHKIMRFSYKKFI